MNKYLKIVSVLFVLTSGVYLPSVKAVSSTEMLITIAETNPVLVERLSNIALHETELLIQLLNIADSKAEQLERLISLKETDPVAFEQLIVIKNAEMAPTKGIGFSEGIGDGGVIRN
jgi:hypothetical protein